MLNVYENKNILRGEDSTFKFYESNFLVVCVADGHGGRQAVEICENNMQKLFSYEISRENNIEKVITSVFNSLHEEAKHASDFSGSTLTIIVLNTINMNYTCANVGDSEAVVITTASHMWITSSHRLQTNSSERQRLKDHISFAVIPNTSIKAGPPRLYPGGLACSRSIGDGDCPYISCEPHIYSDNLKDEEAILICTDGIWDFASFSKILKLTRESYNPEFICRLATKNQSNDDATAVIITKHKQKNSIHTNLFRFFQRNGSNSSLSSDDDEPITKLKVGI